MKQKFDYQGQLLASVSALLIRTEDSQRRGQELVRSCPQPATYSINALIWGWILQSLNDRVMRENETYLREMQQLLMGTSHILYRSYISDDFRVIMSDAERRCFEQLEAIVTWLESFPFPIYTQAQAIAQYHDLQQHAQVALADLQMPEELGDELIYNLIMRHAGALLTNLRFNLPAHYYTAQLSPTSPFGMYHHWSDARHPDDLPDVTLIVMEQKRILASLSNKGWTAVTWELRETSLIVAIQ